MGSCGEQWEGEKTVDELDELVGELVDDLVGVGDGEGGWDIGEGEDIGEDHGR